MKKRLLAAALAAVMLLCLLPAAALAAPSVLWEKQFTLTAVPYKQIDGSWWPCDSVQRSFTVECRADSGEHFYPTDSSLVFEGEEFTLRIAGSADAALYGKASEGGWKFTAEPDPAAPALPDGTVLAPGASLYLWVYTAYAAEGRGWCHSGVLALSDGAPFTVVSEPILKANRSMMKLALKDALDPAVYDREVVELWRADLSATGRTDDDPDAALPFDFSLAAYGAWNDFHALPGGTYYEGETVRFYAGNAKYGDFAQAGCWKIVPGTDPNLPAVGNGAVMTSGVSYYVFSYNGSKWMPVYDLAIPGADTIFYRYAGGKIPPFTIQGIFALREPLDPNSVIVTPPDEPEPEEPVDLSAFTDLVPGEWYEDGIEFCIRNGLMKGYSDTEYGVGDPLNRAMILTVLWRLDGEKVVNYAMSFPDVPEDEWYTEAVRWACAEKIAVNAEGEDFGPFEDVTREEIAAVFLNYAKYAGCDTAKVTENTNTLSFDDIFDVSPWAAEGMNFCIAAKILQGNDGKVFPGALATRGQAAAMFKRLCTALAD